MHDFEPVAFLDANLAERAPRDDLEISLDRDLARVEPQIVKHVNERASDGHMAEVAIDVNRDAFLKLHARRNRSRRPLSQVRSGWTGARWSDRALGQTEFAGKPMPQPKDPAGSGDKGMRIDAKLVRQLAELLSENALTEIEVADGDRRIKVARGGAPTYSTPSHAVADAPALTAPSMHGKEDLGADPAAEEISGTTVKSPMVGTAYLSAEPGVAAFVEVGKPVKAGDTLCIIEAMKVMNPITAPAGGVVKKVMISDGQPVEFDQPLVIIG